MDIVTFVHACGGHLGYFNFPKGGRVALRVQSGHIAPSAISARLGCVLNVVQQCPLLGRNYLGALLLQDNKPIAFASKTLTTAQSSYSDIAYETFGIVNGAPKFHTCTLSESESE